MQKGIVWLLPSCLMLVSLMVSRVQPATAGPAPTVTVAAAAPAATPAAPKKPYGELRICTTSFSGELGDPVKALSSTASNLLSPMYDLMFYTDSEGRTTPGVVERWEIAPDGRSWVYHVRKGIKFHNGEDLTAKDLKFSLDRYRAKDAVYAWLRDAIKSVEIVDDYTVRILTNGTQPFLPEFSNSQSTAFQSIVVSKNYFEKHGADTASRTPMGSGPFKFVKYVPGDMIQYEAMDTHWRGTPSFKTLKLLLVPEASTQVALLMSGGVDMIEADIESAMKLEKSGYKTFSLAYMIPQVILHGTYQPEGAKYPIADLRVRQALSLAINREEIIKDFFRGMALPAMPSGVTTGARDVKLVDWKDYAAKVWRYDPDTAKRLLKEAGHPDGFSIKLNTFAQMAANYLPNLAQIIQGYWGKIGVKAQIVPMDQTAWMPFRNTLTKPNFIGQASTFRLTDYRASPGAQLDFIMHSKGSFATAGKALPELDALIAAGKTEFNDAKRKEIGDKAIRMATETYTYLNIARAAHNLLALGSKVTIEIPPRTAVFAAIQLAQFVKHK